MSWGASAAEGASTAGSAASGASSVGSSTGSIASNIGSATPSAVDTGAGAASTAGNAGNAGGFSLDSAQPAQQTPSFMDNMMNGLEKFQKGAQQTLPEAWRSKSFGNPGTYGYIASKLPMAGGSSQAPNMTTNISYQQPENTYLKKRGY